MNKAITITLIFCLGISISLIGQSHQFVIDLIDIDSSSCTIDPNQNIYHYKNWELYQTENDNWDGNRDSSSCINLSPSQLGTQLRYGIDFSTIQADKALFLRMKLETMGDVSVTNNSLATLWGGINNPLDIQLELGNQCSNEICSGMIIILETEENGATFSRLSKFQFTDINDCNISECFVTEKGNNTLREVIYKFTLADNANTSNPIRPLSISYDPLYDFEIISDDILVGENYYTGTSYDIGLRNLTNSNGWSDVDLVLHSETGLPSSSNLSFIDIGPEIPNTESQTINLEISEWESIFFQSHTSFRGGLLQGSTTERHQLNVINDNPNLCLFVIELTFPGSSNLVLNGGNLHFAQHSSCLQFRNGSELIIGENNNMKYGTDGAGMLFIRSGSTIRFQENANLNFNGHLIFDEFDEYKGAKDINIYLLEGNHWNFGPQAKITKIKENQQINIHMLGGTIDLDHLDFTQREKLNIISYEQAKELPNSKIFPNPARDILNIGFEEPLIKNMTIAITDLSGNLIKKYSLEPGTTKRSIAIGDYPSGLYLVQISDTETSTTQKLIINN